MAASDDIPDQLVPVARPGAAWSAEEEKLLVAEIRAGKDVATIAGIHGRREGGVRYRLYMMIPAEENVPDDDRMEWITSRLSNDPDYDWRTHIDRVKLRHRTNSTQRREEQRDRQAVREATARLSEPETVLTIWKQITSTALSAQREAEFLDNPAVIDLAFFGAEGLLESGKRLFHTHGMLRLTAWAGRHWQDHLCPRRQKPTPPRPPPDRYSGSKHMDAGTSGSSDGNDFDVQPGVTGQHADISGIGRDDLVAVPGEQDQRRVNDVFGPRAGQQGSGLTPQGAVERPDIDPLDSLGQPGLTRAAIAPHLSDDAAMTGRGRAGEPRQLIAPPHRPVIAFEGEQRAAVQDQRHDSPRFRRSSSRSSSGTRPRTTMAASRSARCCAAISASVILPYSAS